MYTPSVPGPESRRRAMSAASYCNCCGREEAKPIVIDDAARWRRRGWLTCAAWLKIMLPYRLLKVLDACGDNDRNKAQLALRTARARILRVMKACGYGRRSTRGFPTRRAFQRAATADVRLPTNSEFQAYATVHMAFVEAVLSLTLAPPWSKILVREASCVERITILCQVVKQWRRAPRFELVNTATRHAISLLREARSRGPFGSCVT